MLDVAAGNGNCALAAARRGAEVVATDFAPLLLEQGRQRTANEGIDVEWQEADAEDLPFPDGSFDCATSVFGAIFAPRPQVVAGELFRVVRPGGVVGLTAWTPDGFTARMMEVLGKRLPPPPEGIPNPLEWGRRQRVKELFEDKASSIDFFVQTVPFAFESFASMREAFEAHGFLRVARQALDEEDYEAGFRDFERLVAEWNQAPGDQILISGKVPAGRCPKVGLPARPVAQTRRRCAKPVGRVPAGRASVEQ